MSCTKRQQTRSLCWRSNPNSLVESLCPTLSVCRLILSDLSLHCERHINNSVRVLILRILMCSVSFCWVCSVSWLIFSGARGFVSLRDLLATYSFTARLPCDRRAAPLPCKIPGGCQHLVVVPHVGRSTFVSRLVVCLAVVCRGTSCGPPTAFPFEHRCSVGVLPGPTFVPQSPG